MLGDRCAVPCAWSSTATPNNMSAWLARTMNMVPSGTREWARRHAVAPARRSSLPNEAIDTLTGSARNTASEWVVRGAWWVALPDVCHYRNAPSRVLLACS